MTGELLYQMDRALSRCGRPLPPFPGVRVVAIPKGFKAWAVFAAATNTAVATVPVNITGDTTWMLRAISSYATANVGLSLNIQFPDGRFLFQGPSDIRAIAGFGSQRFVLTKERACPPGTKVVATFTDTIPAAGQAVPLILEGAYYYHVKDQGISKVARLESSLPRFVAGENQNIMAPCWAFGEGPETPQGFADDPGGWMYTSQVQAIDVGVATAKNAAITLQLERGTDMVVRNLFFNVIADAAAAGNILVKVRDSTGYSFTDDYVLYGVLNGVPFLKDWIVPAGKTIIVDLEAVDYAGIGNLYVQFFAAGTRRRRA